MTDNKQNKVKQVELLIDPVRAQIYFEVMTQKEITAKELLNRLTINRSTLTHHLTKMVEGELLEVSVQATGRPIKYYRLSKEQLRKIIIDTSRKDELSTEEKLRKRIAYLETVIAYQQVISNSVQRVTRHLTDNLVSLTDKNRNMDLKQLDPYQSLMFSFRLVSDEDAAIWNKHYEKFLKEVLSEIEKTDNKKEQNPKHIIFSGIVPLIRKK